MLWALPCEACLVTLGSFLSPASQTLFLCSLSPHPCPQKIWLLRDFPPPAAPPVSGTLPASPAQVPHHLGCAIGTWACSGLSETLEKSLNLSKPPLAPLASYSWNPFNIFLRQLWGRQEVMRGQHVGKGHPYPATVLGGWNWDLWADNASVWSLLGPHSHPSNHCLSHSPLLHAPAQLPLSAYPECGPKVDYCIVNRQWFSNWVLRGILYFHRCASVTEKRGGIIRCIPCT